MTLLTVHTYKLLNSSSPVGICCIQHLILVLAMLFGILIYSDVFLAYNLISGLIAVIIYSPEFEEDTFWLKRNFRVLAIDGEPVLLSLFSILPLY